MSEKSVILPVVRNYIRVGMGVVLGYVLTFLVQKGYLPVDAITPDMLDAFLDSPQGVLLTGAAATAVIAGVDAVWLWVRKSGGAT